MNESRVAIIDLFRFTQNLGEDLYSDHIHFNERVRMQQAGFIAGWLRGFEHA